MDIPRITLGGSYEDDERILINVLRTRTDILDHLFADPVIMNRIQQRLTSGEVSHPRASQVPPAQPSAPTALPRQVAPSPHNPQFSTSAAEYAPSQPTFPSPGISYLNQPPQIHHHSTRHPPPSANYSGQQLSSQPSGFTAANYNPRQSEHPSPPHSTNTSQQSSPPAAQNVKVEYHDKQKKRMEIFKKKTFTPEFCKAIGIEIIKCSKCDEQYIIKDSQRTMSCNRCNKEVRCIDCQPNNSNVSLMFGTDEVFIGHCKENHLVKSSCYICKKKMMVSDLEIHLGKKPCEGKFYCIKCSISFEYAMELVDHKLSKHSKLGLKCKCDGCGEEFENAKAFFKHLCKELKNSSKNIVWKCPFPKCGDKLLSVDAIRYHFENKKILEPIRATPKPEPPTPWEKEILEGFTNEFFEDVGIETYECRSCEEIYRYFPGQIKMTCHECMAPTEIKCKQCGPNNVYDIDSPRTYAHHCLVLHDSLAPCYICEAETTSDNILEHIQPENVQCLQCLKSFKNELLLVIHRYEVHPAGERKWKCKKCRCEIEKSTNCGKCKKNTEHVKGCLHCNTLMETNIEMLRHMKNQQMEVDKIDVDQENTSDVPTQSIDTNKRPRDKEDDDPSELQPSKK